MPDTVDSPVDELCDLAIPRLDLEREHTTAMLHLLSLPADVESYAGLSDEQLTRVLGLITEQERIVAGQKAVLVGLVAERSRPELGLNGLARRVGDRNAEEFLRRTTGSSLSEARRAVEVGRVVVEAAALADPQTGELREAVAAWMHGPARAMQAGALSVEQFRALRDGLGRPEQQVTVEMLTDAAARLLELAPEADADRLRVLAKELRDEIDEAGITDRHAKLHGQRSFRIVRLPDGMSRVVWLLDPESAAVVHEVFDRITSPKLGGPRFVDAEQARRAEAIEQDPRTPQQLASDVMVELLVQGADHDPSRLLGSELPAVRVGVVRESFDERSGHGYVEGTNHPVPMATIERLACSRGVQEVVFDATLRPLDVGRAQRFFTRKQRIAMAVRDGGCLMCGAPPSWTEAHHIKHWVRDRGESNIDDGVLLCRSCHLRVHNEGWEFLREAGRFSIVPPREVDPKQVPRPLESRSRLMRDLLRPVKQARVKTP